MFKTEGKYPLTVGRRLRYAKRTKSRRGVELTVCIAAICENQYIIGASDRMITSGDIQFEPDQPKAQMFTSSIGVLMAGDVSWQAAIVEPLANNVNEQIATAPDVWLNVGDVANLYYRFYQQARLRQAESIFLAPLGLTAETFIQRQTQMDSQIVQQLTTELIGYETPGVAAIIFGIDPTGPHIFTVSPEGVSCQDLVGFASIGIGAGHANSQLMFAGHTRARAAPETLMLVYQAKKRAEVAPGVGNGTDMFVAGPALGTPIVDLTPTIPQLEQIWKTEQRRIAAATRKSSERVNEYVNELGQQATSQGQAQAVQDGDGETPADQENV